MDFTSLQRSSRRVFLTSLGCARNLVDSEVMLGILLKAGYEACQSMEEADFLIINTCSFLTSARQEALETLQKIFDSKKPGARVIAAGCMVQSHKGEISERFPEMHYYIGSGDVDQILKAVESSDQGFAISDAKSYLQLGEVPRMVSTPNHYAYIKIAEGCRKACSFCIIPKIKGPLKSKSQEQVLREFDALLTTGVKEIVLIAQDLGDYGKDRGEGEALANLLEKMLERKGDFWIRLLYLYPDEITDHIISLFQKDPRLCPYVDMPIQHINSEVLKRMHRKTSRSDIEETLKKLKSAVPGIVIRTSLMVGFPGESDEQFRELVDFVEKGSLDNIGIFQYSKEEASYSANLDGHLSEQVKQKRFEKLAKVQKKIMTKKMRSHIGKKYQVLIEGFHPESEDLLVGRFYGQAPDVDGSVIINGGKLTHGFGTFYEVKISDAIEYDLVGKIVAHIAKEDPSSEPLKPAPVKKSALSLASHH